MKIGILGAGYIGRALAILGTQHGHQVMISNSRGPQTLLSTVAAIRCAAGTAEQAAAFGNVIVVAVPLASYRSIPAQALKGKIVIDTGNYYPQRDGQIAALDNGATTTSELLADFLPGAKVVKACNAILAKDIDTTGQPAGTIGRRALPIAGDDTEAKQVVAGLVDQFGFDTVDAGKLSEGWRFERAMPAYCIALDSAGLKQKLQEAELDVRQAEGAWRH
ncbi:NAD(P)-binding domain-containing protein [Cupriavidus sp. CV2]|uniref:NADPH-dependent F420 reductase n=1 Tax=Cupriavidus ulmosensis TaxID=3065913 RepID=UPI00296ADB71|nr:NAD(P)-binding domain-containing protein [Cupriavidus sp. CV2]MDW3681999.1 NAD(P)-binding domain-containing protein [Cupriavidus sp. CV2]